MYKESSKAYFNLLYQYLVGGTEINCKSVPENVRRVIMGINLPDAVPQDTQVVLLNDVRLGKDVEIVVKVSG